MGAYCMKINLRSNELKEMKQLLEKSSLQEIDKNKIHKMIELLSL